MKLPEIAVYVDGGIVQNVSIVDKKVHPDKWEEANYVIIDHDVEGADDEDICKGCLYSDAEHFADYCGREQREEKSHGKR